MTTPPALSEITAAVCFASILLIPCALGGMALINAGLSRSRAAAHSLFGALCVAGTAVLAWCVFGAAFQGYAGRPHYAFSLAGTAWDWLGAERWFLRGVAFDASPHSLAVVFGLFAVALAAIIPVGAAAERWRLPAACASTVVFAGIVFPLFAHWTWGGGWLAQLGFLDTGGAGCIQAVGGLSALAVCRILGPRQSKFHSDGIPSAMPAHSAVSVLFGCFLVWLGYLGLNCAGAILFAGADFGRLTVVPVNATLAAAGGLLASAAITRVRFGKADASISANAWVAGLAASSAGCAVVRPVAAAFIGAIAGVLIVFSIEWLELRFKLDDPAGSISVHTVGGLWGLLAAGLFGETRPGQFLVQLVGVAALAGLILPLSYGLNRLLNRLRPYRVAAAGERQGIDIYELGAGAYPEFMTHTDDF